MVSSQRSFNFIALILSPWLAFGAYSQTPPAQTLQMQQDPKINIFASSALPLEEGEVEGNVFFTQGIGAKVRGCGCSLSPQGGIDRRFNVFNSIKNLPNVIFLDAGGSIFPSVAEINKLHKTIGYKVHHLGNADFKTLLASLRSKKSENLELAPFLLSSYVVPSKYRSKLIDRQNIKLGDGMEINIFGLENEDSSMKKKFKYLSPAKVFDKKIVAAKLNIALSDLYLSDLNVFKDVKTRGPLVILGAIDGANKNTQRFISKSIVHVMGPGSQQNLGQWRFIWNPKTQLIRYNYGVIELTARYSSPENEYSPLVN